MGYFQIHHTTKTGEVRVYEYPQSPYVDAATRLRRVLGRHSLRPARKGYWRTGRCGRLYKHATVQDLLKRGIAVERDGRVFLASRAPQ